jgi:hypothetical protein
MEGSQDSRHESKTLVREAGGVEESDMDGEEEEEDDAGDAECAGCGAAEAMVEAADAGGSSFVFSLHFVFQNLDGT